MDPEEKRSSKAGAIFIVALLAGSVIALYGKVSKLESWVDWRDALIEVDRKTEGGLPERFHLLTATDPLLGLRIFKFDKATGDFWEYKVRSFNTGVPGAPETAVSGWDYQSHYLKHAMDEAQSNAFKFWGKPTTTNR